MLVLYQRLYSSFLSSAMLKKFKYSDSRILETLWTYYFDAMGAKVCMDRYLDRIGFYLSFFFFSLKNRAVALHFVSKKKKEIHCLNFFVIKMLTSSLRIFIYSLIPSLFSSCPYGMTTLKLTWESCNFY